MPLKIVLMNFNKLEILQTPIPLQILRNICENLFNIFCSNKPLLLKFFRFLFYVLSFRFH